MRTKSNFLSGGSAMVLAAVVAMIPALPAVAGDALAPKVTVKFADLDVSKPHDVAVLYSRIVSASEELCAPFDRNDMVLARKMRACVNSAVASAVNHANIPALTSVYTAKMHVAAPTLVASLQNR
jgi:UrcA family protein